MKCNSLYRRLINSGAIISETGGVRQNVYNIVNSGNFKKAMADIKILRRLIA